MLTNDFAAWLALSIQKAKHAPKKVPYVKLLQAPFNTLLNGVQLVQTTVASDRTEVTLDFYYITRFAKRLQIDSEREAKRRLIQEEEDRVVEAKLQQRRQIVAHVESMMRKAEDLGDQTVIQKFAQNAQQPY